MNKKGIFYIHEYAFEFDPQKSTLNKAKHGIDFEDAQAIWSDEDYVSIRARSVNELRYLIVGQIDSKHWSAIITYRRNKIRIISVRRSRQSEIELYEKK